MGRIKRLPKPGRRPKPLTWDQERAELLAKVAMLEQRVRTREAEFKKEVGRRIRQQQRVNMVHAQLRRAMPAEALVRQGSIDLFSQVYADMMRQATDNRVCEALMQIGPHTISDMRIGGDINEEKQPPVLWLTLPELEIRIRVDERLWPAGRLSREEAEKILGRPVPQIEGPK